MLSFFVAIVFSALSLTASHVASGAELSAAAPILQVTPTAETSMGRSHPVATRTRAGSAPGKKSASTSASDPQPAREVSMEMVLAAVALMLVVALRRLHSGPR